MPDRRSNGSNVAVRMQRVVLNLGQFAESRRRCWVGADGWTHIPGFVLLRSDAGTQPMSRIRHQLGCLPVLLG
jgi:hypothetical protein